MFSVYLFNFNFLQLCYHFMKKKNIHRCQNIEICQQSMHCLLWPDFYQFLNHSINVLLHNVSHNCVTSQIPHRMMINEKIPFHKVYWTPSLQDYHSMYFLYYFFLYRYCHLCHMCVSVHEYIPSAKIIKRKLDYKSTKKCMIPIRFVYTSLTLLKVDWLTPVPPFPQMPFENSIMWSIDFKMLGISNADGYTLSQNLYFLSFSCIAILSVQEMGYKLKAFDIAKLY